MKLRLAIVKGAGMGKSFAFTKAPVRIGRGAENELVLNDDGISRLQCELVVEPAGLMLRDLTSANGTQVNGVIATETELKAGDTIGMGPVVFEILAIDLGAKADGPTPMGEGDPGTKPAAPPRKLPPRNDGPALQRRVVTFASVTGLIIAVGAVYWILTHNKKPDHSADIFPVSPATRSVTYGLGDVDVLASDRVSFSFDSQGVQAIIEYAAFSIEREGQVEIVVNGERVGYAPQTASGWTTGLIVIVPPQLLKAGRNTLMFDNLDIPARDGRADDRWAIGQLTISE